MSNELIKDVEDALHKLRVSLQTAAFHEKELGTMTEKNRDYPIQKEYRDKALNDAKHVKTDLEGFFKQIPRLRADWESLRADWESAPEGSPPSTINIPHMLVGRAPIAAKKKKK